MCMLTLCVRMCRDDLLLPAAVHMFVAANHLFHALVAVWCLLLLPGQFQLVCPPFMDPPNRPLRPSEPHAWVGL